MNRFLILMIVALIMFSCNKSRHNYQLIKFNDEIINTEFVDFEKITAVYPRVYSYVTARANPYLT